MGPGTMQPISAAARVTGPLALAVVIARAAATPWAISARADRRASIPHAAARAWVAAGGGFPGGGGGSRGGGGFRGGGRHSDARLKHDIVLLGRLDNGLGFYGFIYNGGERRYVGVMAQEVQAVMPAAVTRGRDGYLLVSYDKLGLKFQTYDEWIASGARVPSAARVSN